MSVSPLISAVNRNRWCNCVLNTTEEMLPRVHRLVDSRSLYGTEHVMNFALRHGGIQTHGGSNPLSLRPHHSATRVYTISTGWFSIIWDGKPFDTNRMYTSGRVVKAEDRGDQGFLPTQVRIPPYLNVKIIQKHICPGCLVSLAAR